MSNCLIRCGMHLKVFMIVSSLNADRTTYLKNITARIRQPPNLQVGFCSASWPLPELRCTFFSGKMFF